MINILFFFFLRLLVVHNGPRVPTPGISQKGATLSPQSACTWSTALKQGSNQSLEMYKQLGSWQDTCDILSTSARIPCLFPPLLFPQSCSMQIRYTFIKKRSVELIRCKRQRKCFGAAVPHLENGAVGSDNQHSKAHPDCPCTTSSPVMTLFFCHLHK